MTMPTCGCGLFAVGYCSSCSAAVCNLHSNAGHLGTAPPFDKVLCTACMQRAGADYMVREARECQRRSEMLPLLVDAFCAAVRAARIRPTDRYPITDHKGRKSRA